MYLTKHTLILGGATVSPGESLTKKQLEGHDIERLIALGAIEAGDILGEVADKKASDKKVSGKKAAAADDDGLGA